ncbi:hypothetical protein M2318_005420 [Metapseudomonas resinovorans]|uniref:hypothetical protein n=1 Tax=Metapseudomonas resinovorans TaxID=53412 RepID=UPI003D25462A
MKNSKSRWPMVLAFAVITVVATLSFFNNLFGFSDPDFFQHFQSDSESLVIGGIAADTLGLEKAGWHLGMFALGERYSFPESMLDAQFALSAPSTEQATTFQPYLSQYGIQGLVFSWLYRLHPQFHDLSSLRALLALLLALTLAALTLCYAKLYGKCFATLFIAATITSPWIVVFARNLYWVPFLWFVPPLIAAWLYMSKSRVVRGGLLVAIALSVFIKSLCGYEYLTSITLLTCSVFLLAPIFDTKHSAGGPDWRRATLTFLACVCGFSAALTLHASKRGDNLPNGLLSIYQWDISKRTYAAPGTFDGHVGESLASAPLDVVAAYFQQWNTEIAFGIPGALFSSWVATIGISIALLALWQRNAAIKYTAMLFWGLITTLSWLVIAKGHSYVHQHMNFVLWYFGFVQMLAYLSLRIPLELYRIWSRRTPHWPTSRYSQQHRRHP